MDTATKTVPVRLEIRPPWRGKIAQLLLKRQTIDQAIGVVMEGLIEEAGLPTAVAGYSLSQDGLHIVGQVEETPKEG